MIDTSKLDSEIKELEEKEKVYRDKIIKSPTAIGSAEPASSVDISNQLEMKRIQKQIDNLTNKKIRAQWYPEEDTSSTEGAPEFGLFGSAIDFITRPLYGVAGIAKHTVGQGSGTLGEDVANNMVKGKTLFGDILRTSGVPGGVAAPLGLALDIGMDPLNWFSMGTAAFLPRVVMGGIKGATKGGAEGALRGLALGAKSGALTKAGTVAKYTPYAKKTKAYGSLMENVLEATGKYEKLTDTTYKDLIKHKGMGLGSKRIPIRDVLEGIADMTPKGRKVFEFLDYDPIDWVRQSAVIDTLKRSFPSGVAQSEIREVVNKANKGEDFMSQVDEILERLGKETDEAPIIPEPIMKGVDWSPSKNKKFSEKMSKHTAKLAESGIDEDDILARAIEIVNKADDAVTLQKNPRVGFTENPIERALRLTAEELEGSPVTLNEIAEIVNSGALEGTGVAWFDKLRLDIKTAEKLKFQWGKKELNAGKMFIDTTDQLMALFKLFKVPLSPTSWNNAVAGNYTMNFMGTGDGGPGFVKRFFQVLKAYRNKPDGAAKLEEIFLAAEGPNSPTLRALQKNETAAVGTFGSIDFIGANAVIDNLTRDANRYRAAQRAKNVYKTSVDSVVAETVMDARKRGIIPEGTSDEVAFAQVKEALKETAIEGNISANKRAVDTTSKTSIGGSSSIEAALKEGRMQSYGNWVTNELFTTDAQSRMFKKIKENAKKPGAWGWKALDWTFSKATGGYAKIDQLFKMTTFVRATVDGYTIDQIRRIRNLLDLTDEVVPFVNSAKEMRYRLSPLKALELSNILYLNYAAMPAAVRILRQAPLAGSPFISFMYGMALKTGQTMVYNPSAFTKVSSTMHEFGGKKTPLEKKALESPYYSYLNRTGMVRLPGSFWDENPVYLNLANMIPYYSLNMFNPSETNFREKTTATEIVSKIQKSPFFKTPMGAFLFDFFVQPAILGDKIAPQGQFGQPLYPQDATMGEKAFYGARTLSEAYVPNILSYAGLVIPSKYSEYLPSYQMAGLSQAKEGKNRIGIKGKEGELSRTIRKLLSMSGFPVQAPVDLTFTEQEFKKANN